MGRKEVVVRARAADQREVKSSDLMAYVRPWLAVPALIPAGYLSHWLWGDAGVATGLASAAIAAAGGTVTYVTHRLTSARTWYAHHIATTMTGMAGVWLTAATAFGPGRPLLDMLIIGGAATAAISDVHLWARGQGQGESTSTSALPSFSEVAEKLRLRNVTGRLVAETDMQQRHQLTLENGETAEGLQSRKKQLASAYGVAPGAVRVIEDQGRADRAELVITKDDVMGRLIPWPGLTPEHVGASIADHPLELGVYEDGEVFRNEITNRHSLTVGMAGAGKSVYGKVKMVQVAARRDTYTMAIDMAKGRQTLGPIEAAIGWSAYDKKSAKVLVKALKRSITARANHLADRGLAQWEPGCGLSFLYLLIEEAAEAVDFDEIVEIARVSRSVGVHLELSLQRATWGNLDTDTRANLGDGLCFGVRDFQDASFVLPDYVTEAGGDPSRWRKSRPGALYAAIEHAEMDRHMVPIKAYGPPSADSGEENRDLAAAAASLPDQDAKLDPVTRAAFDEVIAEEKAKEAKKKGKGRKSASADVDDLELDDIDEASDEEEGVDAMTTDDDVEVIELTTPDDDPELTATIDDPIEFPQGARDIPLAPRKGTQESAEEAKAALDALFQEWRDRGLSEFRAPDVGEGLRAVGIERKRAWIYRQLRRLEEDGVLRNEDDGGWTIVERELAGV